MPRSNNKPPWKLTNTPWKIEVAIWERMSLGENDKQVGLWLDQQEKSNNNDTLHLDRDTISSVRKELIRLPKELAKGLPENIYGYWHSLQKQDEKPALVINTQLLPNNTAEKSNTGPTT